MFYHVLIDFCRWYLWDGIISREKDWNSGTMLLGDLLGSGTTFSSFYFLFQGKYWY